MTATGYTDISILSLMYGRQLGPNPTAPEVIYMSVPVQARFHEHSEGPGQV